MGQRSVLKLGTVTIGGNHRSKDLDLDLNQCENFCIVECSYRVWNQSPNPSLAT